MNRYGPDNAAETTACDAVSLTSAEDDLHVHSRARERQMPDKSTIARARKDKRQGKSASTQAGEFVHEEIEHIREGKHGARSAKQAIAIGLSKARRAGVRVGAPRRAPKRVRRQAARDLARGRSGAARKTSATRSRASRKALKREGRRAASSTALARQARSSARKRTARSRSLSAKKAARTKGPAKRSAAAKKAARTRQAHG